MQKLLNKLAQEDLCVLIGKHKSGFDGWFARVRPYKEPVVSTNTWADSGHGFTAKEALKQGYKVFKGKAKATPSAVFEQ